jgi:hypothetical protein
MLELIHAWNDHDSSFATVHRTDGMSRATRRMLEQYSGIELSLPAVAAPVLAHRIVLVDGVACSILTRITQHEGPSGDRPGRTAHHCILTPSERPAAGPAAVLQSNWFCADWSTVSAYTSASLPSPAPRTRSASLDIHPEWLTLLTRRVGSHTATVVITPRGESAGDLIATIEQDLATQNQWEFTFLTGSDQHPDGVLLIAAELPSRIARRLTNRADGVTLTLSDAAPDAGIVSHEPITATPELDRVELIPATLQPANTTISLPLILLGILTIAVLGLAIAAIGGWLI